MPNTKLQELQDTYQDLKKKTNNANSKTTDFFRAFEKMLLTMTPMISSLQELSATESAPLQQLINPFLDTITHISANLHNFYRTTLPLAAQLLETQIQMSALQDSLKDAISDEKTYKKAKAGPQIQDAQIVSQTQTREFVKRACNYDQRKFTSMQQLISNTSKDFIRLSAKAIEDFSQTEIQARRARSDEVLRDVSSRMQGLDVGDQPLGELLGLNDPRDDGDLISMPANSGLRGYKIVKDYE